MEISNDTSGSVDYVKYFTDQLPIDLARMAALRDELEKRQGAMSAVETILLDREKAKKELADAQSQAAVILATVQAKQDDANKQKILLDNREKALFQRETASEASLKARDSALKKAEDAVSNREMNANTREMALSELAAKITADRTALDDRIKAFQDKVAALNI